MLCIGPVISYVSNEQKMKKAQTLKVFGMFQSLPFWRADGKYYPKGY